jgi:hypothetical protein
MSQNVTLSTISPAQSLALGALVSGGSITKAAKEAGVARETVSRWVHHDPVFIAEMQNARAELASQTRCALEALGTQAVGVLVSAVQNEFVKPWRLKAACAVLKMIGADRAETMPRTTAEEIQLWLQERETELEERRGKLKARVVDHAPSIEVVDDSKAAVAPPVAAENQSAQPCGNGDVTEPAPESTQAPALTADTVTAEQLVNGKLPGIEKVREEVINRFLKSVEDRVKQQGRISARPIMIEPYPANGPLRGKGRRRARRATHPDSAGRHPEGASESPRISPHS